MFVIKLVDKVCGFDIIYYRQEDISSLTKGELMKNLIMITVITATLVVSGCSSSRAQMFKNLKTDSIILCGGSLEGIDYIESTYSTKISCDGKNFEFSKIPKRGVAGVIQCLAN